MAKPIKSKIETQGLEISILTQNREDYISLTDIAKYKNPDAPADVVKNWLRRKDTIEYLGLWEQINNPDFKLVEFDQFRNNAKFPDKKGNQRDNATIEQNIIMASLESSNTLMIRQDLPQVERLKVLRELAVTQLKSVTNARATERIKRLAG